MFIPTTGFLRDETGMYPLCQHQSVAVILSAHCLEQHQYGVKATNLFKTHTESLLHVTQNEFLHFTQIYNLNNDTLVHLKQTLEEQNIIDSMLSNHIKQLTEQ